MKYLLKITKSIHFNSNNQQTNFTFTTFGLVKTLLRIDNSSRSINVSMRKSSVRDDICIKHVKP